MPQLSFDLFLQGQQRMPWNLGKVHCDPVPIVAMEVDGVRTCPELCWETNWDNGG